VQFGGTWTAEKLERVRKYLVAYATIFNKNRHYKFAYIDAFAGSGSWQVDEDIADEDATSLRAGSAQIALKVEPKFDTYIFIEKSRAKLQELTANVDFHFPDLADRVILEAGDANEVIPRLCSRNWARHRAVMFLDPFATQVSWNTLQAIGATKAIDLWNLFPLAAMNRMLRRDGLLHAKWEARLDYCFGADSGWRKAFYAPNPTHDMFGGRADEKTADFDVIGQFFLTRLRLIFAAVAKAPLVLNNSKNSPLFLLCFAVGNPKKADLALRIADHILKG